MGEGKTEYEYHEKVIVRNMKREILERLEGGIQEIRPGEYYILQWWQEIGSWGDRTLRTYENKEELKNEINKSFAKYISEFDDIPEYLKDMRVDEVDRTPAENLAYQVGWTTLVIKWESIRRIGTGYREVVMWGLAWIMC